MQGVKGSFHSSSLSSPSFSSLFSTWESRVKRSKNGVSRFREEFGRNSWIPLKRLDESAVRELASRGERAIDRRAIRSAPPPPSLPPSLSFSFTLSRGFVCRYGFSSIFSRHDFVPEMLDSKNTDLSNSCDFSWKNKRKETKKSSKFSISLHLGE